MSNALLDNVDLWTGAVKARSTAGRGSNRKIELVGVKKLRELILELAVRGKLVPQDDSDEPASELLKRIEAEKAQLIADSQIEKQKPFDLPSGWSFVAMGNICEIERGGSPRPIKDYITDDPNGLNWIKISDTDKGGKYINSTAEKIRPEGLHKTRKVYAGDFLLTNSMSFGRPYISNIEGCIHDGWLRIHPPKILDKDYLYIFLSSPFVSRFFTNAASGAVVQNLNSEKVRQLPILIPPLAEQQRIVAKVDELMQLCDQLEQHTDQQHAAHQQLVETLLNALTQASSAADLAEQWQRIATHFDELFVGAIGEWAVDRLKDSILQLAVMGKLVPQDPTDEPASELLKHIEAEKAQLIRDGKIKKQKPLPPVGEDEKPFELPDGWEWVRFGQTIIFESELVSPDDFQNSDQVAPDSIEKGTGKLLFRRTVQESGVRGPNNRFYKGQILYSKIRPSLSKAVIADFDGLCSADMYPLNPLGNSNSFILKTILSNYFLKQVLREENRIKMPKLNIVTLSDFVITIPPLVEQYRIVDKVDQLFVLCDQLKARIHTANQLQLQLTDTLIEQTLA